MRLAQLIAEADLAPRNHTHPKMEEDISQVQTDVSQIIDILQGPREVGGVRSGGLVADVAELRAVINGGIKASLTPSQKIALAVAAIGGLASIISALILA